MTFDEFLDSSVFDELSTYIYILNMILKRI